MKIFVMSYYLNGYTGSERWVYSVAEKLVKRKIEVDVLGIRPGLMSAKLEEIGCHFGLGKEYDLILVSHNICLEYLIERKIKGRKICIVHGTEPDLEQPVEGADKYVSVSEEVRYHIKEMGFDSEVIYNGVRIPPEPVVPKGLKRVLHINRYRTKQDKKLASILSEICDERGLTLIRLGGNVWDIESHIKETDLIVSIGRGIYEGLAYGKPCIVAGRWGIDGYIADGDYYNIFLECNCSGRRCGFEINKRDLNLEFAIYDRNSIMGFYDKVLKNHDIKNVVDKLLEL